MTKENLTKGISLLSKIERIEKEIADIKEAISNDEFGFRAKTYIQSERKSLRATTITPKSTAIEVTFANKDESNPLSLSNQNIENRIHAAIKNAATKIVLILEQGLYDLEQEFRNL